jgi:hypothetical protein
MQRLQGEKFGLKYHPVVRFDRLFQEQLGRCSLKVSMSRGSVRNFQIIIDGLVKSIRFRSISNFGPRQGGRLNFMSSSQAPQTA